ncbi:MAG: hypothetical protein ABJN69_04635 [Hellea sp.]
MKKFLSSLFGGSKKTEDTNITPTSGTPDFSHIDSMEKAEALHKKGELEKILLFPTEFGGDDNPANAVFVPVGISAAKNSITQALIGMVEDGSIDKLDVSVDYKGNSFIPSKIFMKATHSTKSGQFNPTVEVW